MKDHRDLRTALAGVSPLEPARSYFKKIPCKICGSRTRDFDLIDANKCGSATESYPFGLAGVGAAYVRCEVCGFIFTCDYDDWAPDDFARYIYNDDYRKVDPEYLESRPKRLALQYAAALQGWKDIRILDYGSGAGIFVRNMRAAGFPDAFGFDPFSSPARPTGKFDVVTCFEVIEHSPDPLATLADIAGFLTPRGIALIETGIQPADIGVIRGRWWYIAPRNGHISIFSLAAFAEAAERVNLSLKLGRNQEIALCGPEVPPDDPILLALAGGITRNYVYATLFPPDVNGHSAKRTKCTTPEGWHPIETSPHAPQLRWSRANRLGWELLTPGPARLDLQIKVAMEAYEAFASKIAVYVNGRMITSSYQPGLIAASTVLEEAADTIKVELATPDPVTPLSLGRNQDQRPLGIAVSILPAI